MRDEAANRCDVVQVCEGSAGLLFGRRLTI